MMKLSVLAAGDSVWGMATVATWPVCTLVAGLCAPVLEGTKQRRWQSPCLQGN